MNSRDGVLIIWAMISISLVLSILVASIVLLNQNRINQYFAKNHVTPVVAQQLVAAQFV